MLLNAVLAALYDVPTKRFNRAVMRNLAKFPVDFMFQLSADEWAALRSQICDLKRTKPWTWRPALCAGGSSQSMAG